MPSTPLEIAISQLGVRRGRSAEDDARIHQYLGGDRAERGLDLDYCAAFLLWSFSAAGERIPVNFWRSRACWFFQRRLEALGWRVDGPSQPGDIFFFSRAADATSRQEALLREGEPGHTGMIWRPLQAGFQSIEGNIRIRKEGRVYRGAVGSRHFYAPYRFIRAFYRAPFPSPLAGSALATAGAS